MTETLPVVRSALPGILARQRLTVADLVRRIEESGQHFDRKTVYRLARGEPVRTLNLPVVAAIGRALKLSDPGKLILWSTPAATPPRLQRVDARTQARLNELMARNTEGELDAAERRELAKLGQAVEKLSLENARLLASHARATTRTARPPRRRTPTSTTEKATAPARRHPLPAPPAARGKKAAGRAAF